MAGKGKVDAPPLVIDIARAMIEKIVAREWPNETHLVTAHIARLFSVSRSPVQAALVLLAEMGVARQEMHRGYFVSATAAQLKQATRRLGEKEDAGEAYLAIAADRLAGRLPEEIKEVDLGKAYGLNRPQLNGVLHRMAQEGWIERKPGYGWRFLPILTSDEAYRYSYRFRMTIEPAAILEPAFRLSPEVARRLRDEQLHLLKVGFKGISAVELFEIGSGFHEAIAEASGNPFYVDALRRVNRLRRLIEYKAMSDTSKFEEQCREHLALLDMLENGQTILAADFIRRHLDIVHAVKKQALGHALDRDPAFAGVPHF
jgi:DNA-binding GntR family transcriptional regulator